MQNVDPPPYAAWRHDVGRIGFEAVGPHPRPWGWTMIGSTTAVEDGSAWWVGYELALGPDFATRRATVSARVGDRPVGTVLLDTDGTGHWTVDGAPAPELDGCLDVDLESSSLTNAFPVRRLDLAVGETARAPAAFVRVDLGVRRLEQTYRRLADGPSGARYDYASPDFDVACVIEYDAAGLVLSYPGIAERAL